MKRESKAAIPKSRILRAALLMLAVFCSCAWVSSASAAEAKISIVCLEHNDLLQALRESGIAAVRFDDSAKAIEATDSHGAVLLLADGYPERRTVAPPALLDAAAHKQIRLFIEFPDSLPEIRLGNARAASWQRAVVTSGDFGPNLPAMRLLGLHTCRYLPATSDKPFGSKIVLARVAGFDSAIFGLPGQSDPLLFVLPGHDDVMVCTTKFSQFITARYAPVDAWRDVWKEIFAWLGASDAAGKLRWTPSVAPTLGPTDPLPANAEREAIRRGAAWYQNARLLVDPTSLATYQQADRWNDRVGLTDMSGFKGGDGSLGMLEGFNAAIDFNGQQPIRWWIRADCNGETAFAMAAAGKVLNEPVYSQIAQRLNTYIYQISHLARDERADPASPAYGLVGWNESSSGLKNFYGDDNARLMLGTIGSSGMLASDNWNAPLARCLLGNLRTTGRLGFRNDNLLQDDLVARGWESFFARGSTVFSPHFESWPWACFLWGYNKTHEPLFRDRAVAGIKLMMAAYPDRWRWTNGLQQERARMLLPLAWLIRVDDTPEHRQWLAKIADDLIANQDVCGAIREELGSAGQGMYAPPASNEAYGTAESPLIQKNGDPLSDLLYTTNFAFLGLHEAAAATGEKKYADAEDRLAQFLCRIQVKSGPHPELAGGWFRAFDYRRWDYWASSADAGWGAWSIETGWTQAWIVSVLSMRQLHTSLWDISGQSAIRQELITLRARMIPDSAVALASGKIEHAAVGKPVTLAEPPDPSYAAIGSGTLTDGQLATADDLHGGWLGFLGKDAAATIDLGEPIQLKSLSARFLQDVSAGVFLPPTVQFQTSTDGKRFTPAGTLKTDTSQRPAGSLIHTYDVNLEPGKVRYVRLLASNIGRIPSWQSGAPGAPAWLFMDEIIVNKK